MNLQQLIINLQNYQKHILNTTMLSPYTKKAYTYDLTQFERFVDDQGEQEEDFHTILSLYFHELTFNKHLKAATIKRKLVVLKKLSKYMMQRHIITADPFQVLSCEFPRQSVLPRVLQKQDLSLLLFSVKNRIFTSSSYHKLIAIRDLAIIDLLICTGIRIGEITHINLQDYNPTTNTLLIKGKGQKERILYISCDEVAEELSNWIALRPRLKPVCDSLFINKYGNTFSIFGIENIFYKYRDISGIDSQSTPHYLRHTFASVDTFVA